jgi:hypothetical protein
MWRAGFGRGFEPVVRQTNEWMSVRPSDCVLKEQLSSQWTDLKKMKFDIWLLFEKGGIEVTVRRGRRCRKLLDDLKEGRGYSHLMEEALYRTMWRARFGRGFGPVVRQTNEWMNECPPLRLCLQGTTQLLIDRFSWNLIFDYYSKIRPENVSFISIGAEYRVFYTKTNAPFWSYLAQLFLERKTDKSCREDRNTHFMSNNVFENRTVCEIMRKNVAERGRPQMTIRRACAMHVEYLRLQTHTHRMYTTHCYCTTTMVARTRLKVTLYVHCLYYCCCWRRRSCQVFTVNKVRQIWFPFALLVS